MIIEDECLASFGGKGAKRIREQEAKDTEEMDSLLFLAWAVFLRAAGENRSNQLSQHLSAEGGCHGQGRTEPPPCVGPPFGHPGKVLSYHQPKGRE